MGTATGRLTVTGGNEEPIAQLGGGLRLTRVSGRQRFAGSIEGDGFVDWIFLYRPDATARFTGFQRIDGSIDGRTGSVVLESSGDHDGHRSHGTWRVVPGSGSGGLAGMEGEGKFDAPGGPEASYRLEYRPA